MARCYEWVVYRLKSGVEAVFAQCHAAVGRDLANFEGFLSLETMQGLKDSQLRVDRVGWRDQACALAAYRAFRELSSAQDLMALVVTVEYSGHFLECENSLSK